MTHYATMLRAHRHLTNFVKSVDTISHFYPKLHKVCSSWRTESAGPGAAVSITRYGSVNNPAPPPYTPSNIVVVLVSRPTHLFGRFRGSRQTLPNRHYVVAGIVGAGIYQSVWSNSWGGALVRSWLGWAPRSTAGRNGKGRRCDALRREALCLNQKSASLNQNAPGRTVGLSTYG